MIEQHESRLLWRYIAGDYASPFVYPSEAEAKTAYAFYINSCRPVKHAQQGRKPMGRPAKRSAV